MTERSGVEIDYCPRCRGVWLDRGELDKLLERGDSRRDEPRHDEYREHGKRRKGGWLGELFDFD